MLDKRPTAGSMGTGFTWKSAHHEKDGKFFMNFSEWDGTRQTIFFAESTDLVNWTRLDDQVEFTQDTRWYEQNGRWDCIATIPRPGGGLFGYWSASPKPETGGLFGFGQSLDGKKWEALPPPEVVGMGPGWLREVGGVAAIQRKYYLLLCVDQGKMIALAGERPQGPFRVQEKNTCVLFGQTHFARFVDSPDGPLVAHHIMAASELNEPPACYFAPMKRALVDQEGTLRLAYWEGNDRLKTNPLPVTLPKTDASGASRVQMLDRRFDVQRGFVLEGKFAHLQGPRFLSASQGLYVQWSEGEGVGILVLPGLTQIGTIRGDGTAFRLDSFVNRQMDFGLSPRFRLMVRESLLEFYLNDILIQCYALPRRATGRIGIISAGSGPAIAELSAWN